jgi:ATP phosphoribosyltransferase
MTPLGLTIAVPRGALFEASLDLLDRLGVPTGEVRANERRLVFPDAGLITTRPSDIPTYVEHGAADIGITGKDVLLEQSCWTRSRASSPTRCKRCPSRGAPTR